MAKPTKKFLTVSQIRSSEEGSSTFTGDASTVAFTVNHNLGVAPSQVVISPTTAAAAAAAYVSSKTKTTFVITFSTAPAAAADNIKFDWIAIK